MNSQITDFARLANALEMAENEEQVMIVAGPNSRTDYHCEPGEELFYQLKGGITLKVIEDAPGSYVKFRLDTQKK